MGSSSHPCPKAIGGCLALLDFADKLPYPTEPYATLGRSRESEAKPNDKALATVAKLHRGNHG